MALKRRRKLNADDESEEMTLQITSMADIFTIILVFLLKSLSTGMSNITPTQAMSLPSVSSDSKNTMREALVLEVGKTGVLVDQTPVAILTNFGFEASEEEFTKKVLEALLRERVKNRKREPASVDAQTDPNLLVMADELTPYSTLKAIMNAAATAGYVDLQLVVLKPE